MRAAGPNVLVEHLPGSVFPHVVRVRVCAEEPDFDAPWSRIPRDRVGLAVAVGPRTLVTLASVVAHAVEPTAAPGAGQHRARIATVDHDRDLAVLEVEAHALVAWGVAPVELGELPSAGEVVGLLGAADDAPEATVGHGVVSRVGLTRYPHSQRHLLAAAIDARQPLHDAGDVAFRAGRLIGLVMPRPAGDDTRGELIPPAMIRAVLDAAAFGLAPGVPALGLAVQPLPNPTMRAQLGLAHDAPGVLVTRVDLGGTCDGYVQVHDVLVAIDDTPISSDDTVPIAGHALRHYALLGTRHLGDRARLALLRQGQPLTVELALARWRPLVPTVRDDHPAPYVIYAGLVFQPLTRDYLATWEAWSDKAPKAFLHAYYAGRRTDAQHERVALTTVLEDPSNAGYARYSDELVERVGDHVPRDLADLARVLDAARDVVTIELASGALLMIDGRLAQAATARLLATHGIAADRSLAASR